MLLSVYSSMVRASLMRPFPVLGLNTERRLTFEMLQLRLARWSTPWYVVALGEYCGILMEAPQLFIS